MQCKVALTFKFANGLGGKNGFHIQKNLKDNLSEYSTHVQYSQMGWIPLETLKLPLWPFCS